MLVPPELRRCTGVNVTPASNSLQNDVPRKITYKMASRDLQGIRVSILFVSTETRGYVIQNVYLDYICYKMKDYVTI